MFNGQVRFQDGFTEYVLLRNTQLFFERANFRDYTQVSVAEARYILEGQSGQTTLFESDLRTLAAELERDPFVIHLSRGEVLELITGRLGEFGGLTLLRGRSFYFGPKVFKKSKKEEPAAVESEPRNWIEIELLTDEGEAMKGQKYEVTLPDGSVRQGVLDGLGRARLFDLTSLKVCRLRFPGHEMNARPK